MAECKPKLILTLSLSPSKVTLLALVTSYCAGVLPRNRNAEVLDTIIRFIDGFSSKEEDQISTLLILPSLNDILGSLKETIAESIREQDESPTAISDFHQIERSLLTTLWSFRSLDALTSFITRAKALLVDTPAQGKQLLSQTTKLLARSSFLGRFVSMLVQDFGLIDFDSAIQLFEAFSEYREETRSQWEEFTGALTRKHEDTTEDNFFEDLMQKNRQLMGLEPLGGVVSVGKQEVIMLATGDLEKLIDKQIYLLEAYGTPTPPALRKVLGLMTQLDNAVIPSSHYAKYLEHLRDNDYEGAFECLHRYFDYMMSHNSKSFYHYALLSQATLHANFNCDNEALRSIEEAISVARENKDVNCLNYLLAWLFNFLKDRPKLLRSQNFYATNDQLLQFLKAKSKQTSQSLHAMAYQFEALQIMLDGGPLNNLLETLTKASFLSINDTMPTFIRNSELQATVWSRIGLCHSAEFYVDIALEACAVKKNLPDEVSVSIRKAYILYAQGDNEKAFALLNKYKEIVLKDGALFRQWESRRLVLLIKMSLNKGRYRIAETYLDRLKAQNVVDLDLQYECDYLLARLWTCLENYSQALQLVLGLTSKFQNDQQQNAYWSLKFNLLAAHIFTKTAVPNRGLTLTIKSLTLAKKAGLMPLLMEGALVLSEILLLLDQEADAFPILESAMPQILLLDNLELKSKAYYLLAKTAFKLLSSTVLVKQNGKIDKPDKRRLNLILDYLAIAINGYKNIYCFKEMIACFQVEERLATLINEEALCQHATDAIGKLMQRISEESRYGIID
ncbi:hypothetical protein BABINDRAFT_9801 [Babjeviella inositovora NRRL Y-12698]|uniref:Anaphase-promoting complex subunit 5 n=1 Tax=Babjeviella inositovora NRRL Y-12698 TaxID=984486 RepID=A0A1E3QJE8_9ASCO|nr:uncharacterized protein BABINDRAFT_9801 [Babjeviella inositovora NRRL Y-12698]ODQ77815.1 hypothetical protein BABINDRAFT_9801 [Babjeviella inositovora NRRL Y-12698]